MSFQYRGWPTIIVIAMILIGLAITLALPLSIKPTRDALGELLCGVKNGDELLLEANKSPE